MSEVDSATAHFHQGNLQQSHGQLRAAVASYDRAILAKPDFAEAHANRGVALVGLIRLPEALASFDAAIAIKSNYAEAYFGRAVARLMAGDFAQGWQDFEWRWRRTNGPPGLQRREFAQPLWVGERSLAGKSLLVHSEIGLGDTLQFCRYVTLLSELGITVIFQVQSSLLELLRNLEGVTQVVAEGGPLPAFDYHCPLLSLPLAFKTELDTIPAPCRYLRADPAKVARWRPILAEGEGLRVGLVWRGDPNNPDNHRRSIALSVLIEQLPGGVQYVSLQRELTEDEERIARAHPSLSRLAHDLNFDETAAACECVDLVISVDTSVAHLSAALGRSTWILLPFSPDCRWLLDREDSPWYPTVKLYRQESIGDWRSVLAKVAAGLTEKQRGVRVE